MGVTRTVVSAHKCSGPDFDPNSGVKRDSCACRCFYGPLGGLRELRMRTGKESHRCKMEVMIVDCIRFRGTPSGEIMIQSCERCNFQNKTNF